MIKKSCSMKKERLIIGFYVLNYTHFIQRKKSKKYQIKNKFLIKNIIIFFMKNSVIKCLSLKKNCIKKS